MGNVYLSFTDSRDAKNAFEKVHLLRPEWHIVPLTARELAQRSDPSLLSKTSDFEGQLLVAVYYDSRNPKLNQHSVSRSLEALVLTFGDIKTFTQLSNSQDNVSEFHLEFFNTRDAENASISLNGARVDVRFFSLFFFLVLHMVFCVPPHLLSGHKKEILTFFSLHRIAFSKFRTSIRI